MHPHPDTAGDMPKFRCPRRKPAVRGMGVVDDSPQLRSSLSGPRAHRGRHPLERKRTLVEAGPRRHSGLFTPPPWRLRYSTEGRYTSFRSWSHPSRWTGAGARHFRPFLRLAHLGMDYDSTATLQV